MIRGTTAQFQFKLPYSMNELEWITIKFWQPENPHPLLPITKYKSNCEELDDGKISVSLLSTETARFSDKYKAIMQLRAQPAGGEVFGCKKNLITVYPMLDDIIEEDSPVETAPTEEGWILFDGDPIVQ